MEAPRHEIARSWPQQEDATRRVWIQALCFAGAVGPELGHIGSLPDIVGPKA